MDIKRERKKPHGAAPTALGRPKDLSKRDAMISAARDLFFASGVEAVAIERVASRAGVSKVTVYSHFGSKLGLFAAVIQAEMDKMQSRFTGPHHSDVSLEARLLAFGTVLIEHLTSPDLIAFDRLVRGEAERHPEFATAHMEHGPWYTVALLERELQATAGQLSRKAAEQLASLWFGLFFLEIQMGVRPKPSRSAIAEHVAESVKLILRGYQLQ